MVLSRWLLVGIVALIFGLIYYVRVKRHDVNYLATTSFMVKEDEGSSSLFSNILGQFGLSGGRKGEYNLDRLVRISKSHKIMVKTVFSRGTIDDKEDYLINHIMDIYDFETDFRFPKAGKYAPKNIDLKNLTRDEVDIVYQVNGLLRGSSEKPGKFGITYNEESGIIYMSFSTRNEQLSKILTSAHYSHLSEFYVLQAKEKQEITHKKLIEKKDSLQAVLQQKEYELAKMNDQGFGVILKQNKVAKTRLNNEIFVLNTMYSELIKNVENASFNLKNATPVFQVIDTPQYPLDMKARSTIRAVATGLIVGGLLAAAAIIGIALVREAYEEREQLQ